LKAKMILGRAGPELALTLELSRHQGRFFHEDVERHARKVALRISFPADPFSPRRSIVACTRARVSGPGAWRASPGSRPTRVRVSRPRPEKGSSTPPKSRLLVSQSREFAASWSVCFHRSRFSQVEDRGRQPCIRIAVPRPCPDRTRFRSRPGQAVSGSLRGVGRQGWTYRAICLSSFALPGGTIANEDLAERVLSLLEAIPDLADLEAVGEWKV